MPQFILTDFQVSGPKSWNVQIAMSVKLRLPCFSKDIQAWLLHAFDICRLASPPPPARTSAGAPRRTADRCFVGAQVRFLSRSPFLLTSSCWTCFSQCSQSSWKRSSWHLCAFPFFLWLSSIWYTIIVALNVKKRSVAFSYRLAKNVSA